MSVFPDFDGLGGIGDLKAVIGALLTFVLIIAVLMLIVSAIIWAIATAHGNHATASKVRTGLLVALGTAALAGSGVAWAYEEGQQPPRRTPPVTTNGPTLRPSQRGPEHRRAHDLVHLSGTFWCTPPPTSPNGKWTNGQTDSTGR